MAIRRLSRTSQSRGHDSVTFVLDGIRQHHDSADLQPGRCHSKRDEFRDRATLAIARAPIEGHKRRTPDVDFAELARSLIGRIARLISRLISPRRARRRGRPASTMARNCSAASDAQHHGRRRKAQAALSCRRSFAKPSTTLPTIPAIEASANGSVVEARRLRKPQALALRDLRPWPAQTRPVRTQISPRAAHARDRKGHRVCYLDHSFGSEIGAKWRQEGEGDRRLKYQGLNLYVEVPQIEQIYLSRYLPMLALLLLEFFGTLLVGLEHSGHSGAPGARRTSLGWFYKASPSGMQAPYSDY